MATSQDLTKKVAEIIIAHLLVAKVVWFHGLWALRCWKFLLRLPSMAQVICGDGGSLVRCSLVKALVLFVYRSYWTQFIEGCL